MNQQQLMGLSRPPLQAIGQHWLQPAAAAAFLAMQHAAAADGLQLKIASSYRDFANQQRIWQAKLANQRPVFDRAQQRMDLTALGEREKLYAILHFSALPGTSRHHWGTDLDIFDSAAIAADYQLQLTPAEYQTGGPFAKLDQWLSQHASRFGFFRPYQIDQGGVAIEPWHLSYRPLAAQYLRRYDIAELLAAHQQHSLFPDDLLRQEIQLIMSQYVLNIWDR